MSTARPSNTHLGWQAEHGLLVHKLLAKIPIIGEVLELADIDANLCDEVNWTNNEEELGYARTMMYMAPCGMTGLRPGTLERPW